MYYSVEDHVRWSVWDDEAERTGTVLEVDEEFDYYIICEDMKRANKKQMHVGLPGKSILGLAAASLPDNVVLLDNFRSR